MSVDFRRLSKLAKNFKSQAVNLSWKKKEISKFCIKNISKWMCKELAKRVAVRNNPKMMKRKTVQYWWRKSARFLTDEDSIEKFLEDERHHYRDHPFRPMSNNP